MQPQGAQYGPLNTNVDGSPDELPSPPPLPAKPAVQTTQNDAVKTSQHSSQFSWNRIQSGWTIELVAWLLGLGCVAAIVGLLLSTNGTARFVLSGGIKLSATISVLAQIAATLLGVSLSASIGQVKWIWFRQPRPLVHYRSIDEASKGFIGSLLLLCHWRGGLLAISGAILSVLLLAVPPAAQQTLGQTFQSPSVPVTIPLAQYAPFFNYSSASDNNPNKINAPIQASLMTGSLSRTVQDYNDTLVGPVTCQSNNCSFSEPYQSLGICSSCANITDLLTWRGVPTPEGRAWGYQLPNGFFLSAGSNGGTSGFLNLSTGFSSHLMPDGDLADAGKGYASQNFRDSGAVLTDIFAIAAQPSTGVRYSNQSSAFECILQLCVHEYTAKFYDGALHETETPSSPFYNNSLAAVLPNTASAAPVSIHPPGSKAVFQASGMDMDYLRAFISTQLTGYISFYEPSDSTSSVIVDSVADLLFVPGGSLDGMMNNIARSLTQTMRVISNSDASCTNDAQLFLATEPESVVSNNRGTQIPCGPFTATGTSTTQTPAIKVDWGWIALPVTAVILTLALQLLIMAVSRATKTEAWKSDGLAAVFHGYNDPRLTTSLAQLGSMHDLAGALRVKLARDGETAERLVYCSSHDGEKMLEPT